MQAVCTVDVLAKGTRTVHAVIIFASNSAIRTTAIACSCHGFRWRCESGYRHDPAAAAVTSAAAGCWLQAAACGPHTLLPRCVSTPSQPRQGPHLLLRHMRGFCRYRHLSRPMTYITGCSSTVPCVTPESPPVMYITGPTPTRSPRHACRGKGDVRHSSGSWRSIRHAFLANR